MALACGLLGYMSRCVAKITSDISSLKIQHAVISTSTEAQDDRLDKLDGLVETHDERIRRIETSGCHSCKDGLGATAQIQNR